MEEQGPRPAVASFALERHTGQVALPWEGRGAAKRGERKRSGERRGEEEERERMGRDTAV